MTRAGRIAAALAAFGIGGLAILGGAYRLTREPAPSIRVRWRVDVSSRRQAELERKYLLTNGGSPNPDSARSLSYLLLDTRHSNIAALVSDPEAADTNDIDRRRNEIRPGTARAGEMWVAHRTPGLRDARFRWTLIIALAMMVIAGLTILAPIIVRSAFAAARRISIEALRAFDAVASRWQGTADWAPIPGSDPYHVVWTLVAGALVLVTIGVPLLDTWRSLLLAAGALALVFGVRRRGPWRLAAAAAIAIAVLGVKAALPRADIAEAHNAFIVLRDGEPLERGLPGEIFSSWKAQFAALYPADPGQHAELFQWREHPDVNLPIALFTQSADAIWRPAKYTRQVDAIDFHTLGEFRGGFANESELEGLRHANRYNFWAGQLRRESMPFYVMYELTPASVGSRLAWTGQLFWERANGRFEEINHQQVVARTITADDAGKRVYAAFFAARDHDFHFALERSLTLRFAAALSGLLSIAGVVSILLLTNRPRWDVYLGALAMFFVGYVVLASHVPPHAEYLGIGYPPHSGGNDGMVHDGWGRTMAMLARRGQIGEALRGAESVYWFTPGMRYFRMIEKLIFGDTNHLYALTLACIPIAMFYLFRHFIRARWALMMTGVFCVMPVGNLSFLQYVVFGQAGYGEPIAAGLFFLGLTLMLRTQRPWGGSDTSLVMTAIAGAALAISMFIRPNFSFAVVWLGAAYAWSSWRRKQAAAVCALALGLGLAIWMPLHNWYYGREFYLISKSGATLSVSLGVSDYVAAAGDVIRGRLDTHATAVTSAQLRGWLLGPVFEGADTSSLAGLAHGMNLFALLLSCVVAGRWLAGAEHKTAMGVVAVAVICAHLPLLFVFGTNFRYAMLGWDLSLILLVAWVAGRFTTVPVARAGFPPAIARSHT